MRPTWVRSTLASLDVVPACVARALAHGARHGPRDAVPPRGSRGATSKRRGCPRADAERRARQEFGDVIRWKEAGREARGLAARRRPWRGSALRGARHASHTPVSPSQPSCRSPLGIGATTAMLGLLDLLLLRPPCPCAIRTSSYTSRQPANVATRTRVHRTIRGSKQVASRADLFSDAMLVRHDVYKVGIGGRVEPLSGQRVSANYYHACWGFRRSWGIRWKTTDRPDRVDRRWR